MRSVIQLSLAIAFVLAASPVAHSAPLIGVYTCANGNPGNSFDYADIGDFFDDLEDFGVAGPVTLNVFDDGGPFTSTASYALGVDPPLWTPQTVLGLGLNSRLTIRAPQGESPEIVGSGVVFPNPPAGVLSGTMFFYRVGYTTLDGLTIRGGTNGALDFQGSSLNCSYITVSRCRINGVSDGCGVSIVNESWPELGPSFVLIENNMFWGCGTGGIHSEGQGIEWIIRHNTILGSNVVPQFGGFWSGMQAGNGAPLEVVVGNAIRVSCATANVPVVCVGNGNNPGPFAIMCDCNVYEALGTARVASSAGQGAPPTFGLTFAQWQALGYDAHSLNTDPKLANTLQGQENLHLRHDSPCIDFVPLLTVGLDIEGDARPYGPARDAGADEFIPPIMALESGGLPVLHSGVLNLGAVPAGGVARTFTVRNTGLGPLYLYGNPLVDVVPGLNCAPATGVQAMPALTILPPNGSTDFTLFIQPAAPGPMGLAVAVGCNDPLRSPYSFNIAGVGLPPNTPARANPAAGSGFVGPQNGPFQYTAQPGAALASAEIELTDADADAITVVSISLLSPAPTGVSAPPVPAPGQPLLLSWTGFADAANPPGNYAWEVKFQDAGIGTLVSITVTLQILNAPPTHLISAAQGGDGSAGNPYQCGFNRGDDGAAGVNLCTVTDPNTGQTPFISQTLKAGTNPGLVNFVFALNAGMLSVSPAGMLNIAEAGQHDYEVQVSDGVNLVGIHVLIFVANQPMNFTTPSQLASGETGTAYTATLTLTGAVGVVTYTLTTGQLPDGLALDTSTGTISGTPTQAEAANFTIEAEDATGATATRAFQLTITDPPTPPGPQPRAQGNDGCAVAHDSRSLLLFGLLALLLLRWQMVNGKGQMARPR